jgi:inner membrane protein
MESNQPAGLIRTITTWIQESITVKLFTIGFLVLILLIPSAWIQSIIEERKHRAGEVMNEVFSTWSGGQTLCGPVLVLPYKHIEHVGTSEGKKTVEETRKAFFLPNTLQMNSTVSPSTLHRGIFDAVVYNATVDVNSTFNFPKVSELGIAEENIIWKDAYYAFSLSDMRGITENPSVSMNGKALEPEPSSDTGISLSETNYQTADYSSIRVLPAGTDYSSRGMIMKTGWASREDFNGDIKMKLQMKGSRKLYFIPAGKTTEVKIGGEWNNPSFNGEFSPATREVGEKNFSATWKILHFNRPFAGQWLGGAQQLSGSDFGVDLILPADQYQKSVRTAKYGVLIILLTFVALLMVEVMQRLRIHPFQYILIGAALTIYYILLLSLSEHLGYNISYLISSSATVLLITLYAMSFMKSTKLAGLFAGVLSVFYVFIFIIIQERDYSLVIGSVGLFITIALLMYFSRKINWYQPSSVIDNP